MKVIGIGTDILEVDRIEKAINKNNKFMTRIFTDKELKYFEEKNNSTQVITGNFCAKEAIVKALGTGFREVEPINIEVLRDNLGKPVAEFLNDKVSSNIFIQVSISHIKEYATASAIAYEK